MNSGNPSILTLADIDDSILQSGRKSGNGPLEAVAVDKAGQPCGFMRPEQRALFDQLNATTTLVPNTARDSKTLARVQLPFSSWKICSYGGLILRPDGQPESRWQDHITAEVERNKEVVAEQERYLDEGAARLGIDVHRWCLVDGGNRLYLVAKHKQRNAAELALLRDVVSKTLPSDWQLHYNDNNLALIPSFLGKEKAATWLINELKPTLVLGLGDSLIDLPFMGGCHYALVPTHSQIFDKFPK